MSQLALWRRRDVVASGVAGALALLLVYYVLLTRVTTLHRMVSTMSSIPIYVPMFVGLVLVTVALFGANFGLLTLVIRARLSKTTQAGSVLAGIVGGIGAGCPSCGAYLLSIVGVGAGLAALPFGGLELWAVASLLMAINVRRSLRSLDLSACGPDGAACLTLPSVSHVHTVISVVAAGILSLTLVGFVVAYQ